MAISGDATNGLVFTNAPPATVTTEDILTFLSITDEYVEILGTSTIQSGAHVILDSREGLIKFDATTGHSMVVNNSGTLTIGQNTADFTLTVGGVDFPTGTRYIDRGVSGHFSGNEGSGLPLVVQSGGTINIFGGFKWEGYFTFNSGCTANWYGGSTCFAGELGGGSAQNRVRASEVVNFIGIDATTGNDETAITTIGPGRFDFITDPVFTGNAGFSGSFTQLGAFQAVAGNGGVNTDLLILPGVATDGLAASFVGDAFNNKKLYLQDPLSSTEYNVTHNPPGAATNNAHTLMYVRYAPEYRDADGNLVNARVYLEDEGPDTGFPALFVYNGDQLGIVEIDTFTSPTPENRLQDQLGSQLNYQHQSVTNGFNNIFTRVLEQGDSGGGNYINTTNGTIGEPVITHYRFTQDNNDTAKVVAAAYGQQTIVNLQNLIGMSPYNPTVTMTPDAVVAASGIARTAAAALTESNNLDEMIAVIESNYQSSFGNLFRYGAYGSRTAVGANDARKPWTDITSGDVTMEDFDLAIDINESQPITYAPASQAISIRAVSPFTGGTGVTGISPRNLTFPNAITVNAPITLAAAQDVDLANVTLGAGVNIAATRILNPLMSATVPAFNGGVIAGEVVVDTTTTASIRFENALTAATTITRSAGTDPVIIRGVNANGNPLTLDDFQRTDTGANFIAAFAPVGDSVTVQHDGNATFTVGQSIVVGTGSTATYRIATIVSPFSFTVTINDGETAFIQGTGTDIFTSGVLGGTRTVVDPIVTTVTFPAVDGNFYIRNNTTNTQVALGTTSQGAAAQATFTDADYATASDVVIYWAADGYLDQFVTFNGSTAVTIQGVEDPNKAAGTLPGTATFVNTVTNGILTVSGVTDAAAFSEINTNLYWSAIKGTPEYLQVLAENELTTSAITLITVSSTQLNSNLIKFVSGSNPARVEQFTNITFNPGTPADFTTAINLEAPQANISFQGAYSSAAAQADYEAAGLTTVTDLDGLARTSDVEPLY